MKNIFNALNQSTTTPESGEQMNIFEQARFYERFTESLDVAVPQKRSRIDIWRRIGSMAACAAVVIALAGGAGYGLLSLYRNTPQVGTTLVDPSTPAPEDSTRDESSYTQNESSYTRNESSCASTQIAQTDIAPEYPEAEDATYRYILEQFSSDALGFCDARILVMRKDGADLTAEETGAFLYHSSEIALPIGIASLAAQLEEPINEPTKYVTLMVSTQQIPVDGSFTMLCGDTPITFSVPSQNDSRTYYHWNGDEIMLSENGMLMRRDSALAQYIETTIIQTTKCPHTDGISGLPCEVTLQKADGTKLAYRITGYGHAAQEEYCKLTMAPVGETMLPHSNLPLAELERICIKDQTLLIADAVPDVPTYPAETDSPMEEPEVPSDAQTTTEIPDGLSATTSPDVKCHVGEEATTQTTPEASPIEEPSPTD